MLVANPCRRPTIAPRPFYLHLSRREEVGASRVASSAGGAERRHQLIAVIFFCGPKLR